jgi:hypothetical protein
MVVRISSFFEHLQQQIDFLMRHLVQLSADIVKYRVDEFAILPEIGRLARMFKAWIVLGHGELMHDSDVLPWSVIPIVI